MSPYPYDFVRTDWKQKPIKQEPRFHHKFYQGSVSGKISCQLTAETLIFIPTTGKDDSVKEIFSTHRNSEGGLKEGAYFIPGSSLKGLFRNLVEVFGNGCYSTYDGRYEKNKINYINELPSGFKKCNNPKSFCIGCRLFGNESYKYKGLIQISDAEYGSGEEYGEFIVDSIDAPKPRHKAFYLDQQENYISGRKFYFHSGIPVQGKKNGYNAKTIFPLKPGSVFMFNVHFYNLSQKELNSFLFALVLEENMRHKIGFAKAKGFGSVQININGLKIIDRSNRYLSLESQEKSLSGEELTKFLNKNLYSFKTNSSDTFKDLRRIWRWPPIEGAKYEYKSQKWFKEPGNSQVRLHQIQ